MLGAWMSSPAFDRAAKAAFAAAVFAAFVGAVWPDPSADRLLKSDKLLHIVAFYVLGALGYLAFPRAPLWRLGLALSAYGALIEACQGLPIVGRDADFWDWVADTAAVGAAILPVALARLRDKSRG